MATISKLENIGKMGFRLFYNRKSIFCSSGGGRIRRGVIGSREASKSINHYNGGEAAAMYGRIINAANVNAYQ